MTKLHQYKHIKQRKTLVVKKQAKPLLVDRLIYLAAIIEPLFSLPQSYSIWHTHSAGSVSILTWIGYVALPPIWIWYAITHKERVILLYQGLFLLIDGSVLIGAIYYGGKLF